MENPPFENLSRLSQRGFGRACSWGPIYGAFYIFEVLNWWQMGSPNHFLARPSRLYWRTLECGVTERKLSAMMMDLRMLPLQR